MVRRMLSILACVVLAGPAAGQVPGTAFQGDGADDYVATTRAFGQPSALTIAAWVKLDPASSGGSFVGDHVSGSQWESVELTNGSFTITSSNSSASRQIAVFPGINDGTWHHLAGVWNGVDVRVYRDGVLVAGPVAAPNPPWNSAKPMWFGARQSDLAPPTDAEVLGMIDEIQIWNVARSQAQIAAGMYQVLGPPYLATPDSGLVGYWRFETLSDLGFRSPGPNDVRDLSFTGAVGDVIGTLGATGQVAVPTPHRPGRPALRVAPNPFHAATGIIVEPGDDRLSDVSIFDLHGRRVTRLADASPGGIGASRFSWDGRDLAGKRAGAGVYLVRARTEKGTEVAARVVLLD